MDVPAIQNFANPTLERRKKSVQRSNGLLTISSQSCYGGGCSGDQHHEWRHFVKMNSSHEILKP
jgi:hypothetical protein